MSGPRPPPPGNDLKYQDTMSLRPDLFESGLHASSRSSNLLDALIRKHLETATLSIKMSSSSPPTPPPASSESANLLNELGDYFARTARMWSSLTESLMEGPHIDNAMLDVHDRSDKGTYYADLSAITDVDVEIGRLRKIRDLTAKYSRDVQEVWRPYVPVNAPPPMVRPREMSTAMESRASLPEPASPMADVQHDPVRPPRPDGLPYMSSQPSQSQSQSQAQSQSHDNADSDGDSDDESDDEDLFANIDMSALSQRGKGVYHCPKGMRCDKGGVDKDGNLVVFDRNSSFAQHCNKHRKPWRCDLPGCPNPPKKRRFARRDGLERHKSTVKHYVMG